MKSLYRSRGLSAKAEGLSPVDPPRSVYLYILRKPSSENYSFKIFTRQNKTVTENNLVNDIEVTVHHFIEKCQNYAFCLCCGR